MFSVGEQIIYGSMGVCTVMDICLPDLPGVERECYILKPHHVANSKIYAPVENNPVKMRSLLTEEEVHALIEELPKMKTYPGTQDKQEFHEICRSTIKSADSTLLAKLLKTLYEKKQRIVGQKKIVPSAEKEYFETAEKMLFGEFAAVLQIPMQEVAKTITTRLEPEYESLQMAVS